jgi:hypothetical protein
LVVFPHRTAKRNWAAENRKIFLLSPIRSTPAQHSFHLSLSRLLSPPRSSTTRHRRPPPHATAALLHHPGRAAARFCAPAGSGHHATATHLMRRRLHTRAPPSTCACHHRWHLLRSRAIYRGASSGCRSPRPPLRRSRRPLPRAAAPSARADRYPLLAAHSPPLAGRPLSSAGRPPALLCQ